MARWEAFLNGSALKQRITARYLYEHWFVAHLYFEDLPTGPFFRVVRSRTPPGAPVDEIATRRPYDDPGGQPFWYRLRPLDETIVHKTHIVYPLSDAKRRHLAVAAVGNASDFEALVERWGVRRTSPRLWPTVDWIHDDFRRREPTEFGLFDLDRYDNL